ncbi:hypothetical protein ONZ51_g10648 [Trametes cubensis]|uniref:Reverse transcriptase RNase H-like domain-containing protein n=1 Tax=Trametes cubensis TaxID=1111947 RepID=A0AAD7TJF2_9APHY|nr:hypothetical protein ONZ51_g10648 [Trametes cubensis]
MDRDAPGPLIGKICHVYLDDIIIWSSSLEEHRRNVELVLQTLRHRISQAGIEPDGEKVSKIANWPTPSSAPDVRSFLGLKKSFKWTADHDQAFDDIKRLVLGHDCLTIIDHLNMGENKIFVSTDASDFCTGAVLMYGPSPETARPVAFESAQLKAAELNYPVHEKELLAIVRALKKWRIDLLGVPFTIFTDHRTLENFTTQKHLSRRQALMRLTHP